MSRLWGDEEDTLLREICASGEKVPAPQIAIRISEKFGISPPLTRAAVVGRARRLKIKLPIPRPTRKEASATPQHNITQSLPFRRTYEPDRRILARQALMPQLPRGMGVFLLNASDSDCRRPVAGRGAAMIVCGNPVVRKPYAGVGYCEGCLRIMLTPEAYQKPQGNFVLPVKRK